MCFQTEVQGPYSCYLYSNKKSHKLIKQMIIKGEATGGPTSPTLRERLGEVCTRNKDELKRRWYLLVKEMHLVLNTPA